MRGVSHRADRRPSTPHLAGPDPFAPAARAISVAAALLVLVTAVADGEPIGVRSVAADPTGPVRVSDLSGSVIVTGWPEARVRLTGSVGKDASGAELRQRKGGVEIGVVVPQGLKPSADVAGNLIVNAPIHSVLTVDSTSASVRVDRMADRMVLSSVTGQLFVSGREPLPPPLAGPDPAAARSPADSRAPDAVPAAEARAAEAPGEPPAGSSPGAPPVPPSSIDARSIAGAVLVYGQHPKVAASTVSGSIDLRGAMPDIFVATTKGNVRIVDTLLRDGRVSAISGGIYLWCRLPAGARLSLKSLAGVIFLRLTPDSEPRIILTSYSGRISTNRLVDRGRPIEVVPPRAGESATAVIGRGDSTVTITDFVGDIILTNEPPPKETK